MKPYAFVLVIFRLVALGIIFYWLFSTARYLLSPVPEFGPNVDVGKLREFQQQAFIKSSILLLGSGMALYFASPPLARMVAEGTEE